MTIELRMLVWSIVLGLIQIAIAAAAATAERGLPYNMSARDEPMPRLAGVAGRLDRARANFLETFAFFAAAVLIAHVLNVHNSSTVWGAQLYFWARLVYVPAYALGIPVLRTLIWAVSVIGIVMLLFGLM